MNPTKDEPNFDKRMTEKVRVKHMSSHIVALYSFYHVFVIDCDFTIHLLTRLDLHLLSLFDRLVVDCH